jgi:hypothetical protein
MVAASAVGQIADLFLICALDPGRFVDRDALSCAYAAATVLLVLLALRLLRAQTPDAQAAPNSASNNTLTDWV